MKNWSVPLVLVLSAIAAGASGIATTRPNPEAPEEIRQFGQLVGSWHCKGSERQQDGSWKETPGVAIWDWYYVLDGYAVQDVWRPDTEANPDATQGTNLRTFDPETGMWDIVWTKQDVPQIERFRAGFRDGEIHMFAERPAGPSYPRHLLHVTFHNIGDDRFDWRYETSGLTDGQNWRAVARLSCRRAGAEPDAENRP